MRLATGDDPREVFGVPEDPSPEPTPPEVVAEDPAPPAPQPDDTAPVAPEPDDDAAHADEGKPLPDRFRFSTEEDRKIALLAKQLEVSLPEAVAIYAASKKPAEAPAADPKAPPAPPAEVVEIDSQLQEIDAEIAKSQAARKQAREDVDYDKADELSDSIAEATARKTQLAAQRKAALNRQANQAAQSFDTQVSESANRVYAQFPELADVDGASRLGFEGFIERAARDPVQAKVFDFADWPERLGKQFSAKTGMKAKGTNSSPATPAPTPTLPPPPPNARPPAPKPSVAQQTPGAKLVTGPAGNPPAEYRAKPTTADLVAGLRGMSEKQREALIAAADI